MTVAVLNKDLPETMMSPETGDATPRRPAVVVSYKDKNMTVELPGYYERER
jgi:hypothetical protein